MTGTERDIFGLNDAFDELYGHFSRRIYGYFKKDFGADDAEELTQETFMKLWLYLLAHPAANIAKPKSLLFRIAKNVRADKLRKKPPAFFSLEEDGEFACTVTDAFFDEVEKQIALSQLAESERRLLQMSASGYKSREIGKTLGISASAVRSRIAAAREKLNEYL